MGNVGGVVLVIADESTANELLCGAAAELSEGRYDGSQVRYHHIDDIVHLGPALAALGRDVIALVLDPEFAAPDDEVALRVAAQLVRTGREMRVVVYTANTPQAMHAVIRLLTHLHCELVVRGFDSLPDWTPGMAKNVESSVRRREALKQLTILPARYRLAWSDALAAPGEATIKRVLACASVERRSLERAHEEAGAWTPARLLRALKADDG